MSKIYLLFTTESYFEAISLIVSCCFVPPCKACPAASFPLYSSLWYRQMHQSRTLSSNYLPLTIPCQAGTCPIIHRRHWWVIKLLPPLSLFSFCFSVYCRLSSLTTGRWSEGIKFKVIIPIVLCSAEAWKMQVNEIHLHHTEAIFRIAVRPPMGDIL